MNVMTSQSAYLQLLKLEVVKDPLLMIDGFLLLLCNQSQRLPLDAASIFQFLHRSSVYQL